jgi:hypothetical protein
MVVPPPINCLLKIFNNVFQNSDIDVYGDRITTFKKSILEYLKKSGL